MARTNIRLRRLVLAPGLVACGGGPSMQPMPPAPPSVDTAAYKYPDLRTFWSRAISRTCGPNNGVCHNSRQYPDLQTSSGLLGAVGRRCNEIRDNPMTFDNLCEPSGDLFQIGGFTSRIGTVIPDVATGTPKTLQITLHDAVPAGTTGAAAVVRQRPGLPKVSMPVPAAALVPLKAGDTFVTLTYAAITDTRTAPAPGGSLAQFLLPITFTPGDDAQVEMGDANRDGIFGADLGGALVKPGDPAHSYLFLRVLSPLAKGPGQMITNSKAPVSTEAQMPIANFQYWDIDNAAVALWCWISGMKADGSNADGPIDYAHCDTSAMPSVMHQGGEATTFSSVYETILRPQCTSCHFAKTKEPTTFYMDDLETTYNVLLGQSGTGPSEKRAMLPFVTRSDRTKSYLYLKVAGDPSIEGAKMPLGGGLPASAVEAIGTWIEQGAYND